MKSYKLAASLMSAAIFTMASASNAAFYTFTVILDGPSESPANASPGTGSGTVTYDSVTHLLGLSCSFSGLTGTTTASHIHGPTLNPFASTAGVMTTTPSFVGFPLGVTAGTFSNTLDLTQSGSWNPAFVTAQGSIANAEATFVSAMLTGRAYWNIHSSTFGGGEIRGFLVPEPSSIGLATLAGGYLVTRRKRSHSSAK